VQAVVIALGRLVAIVMPQTQRISDEGISLGSDCGDFLDPLGAQMC
jgi:hypothetical protein